MLVPTMRRPRMCGGDAETGSVGGESTTDLAVGVRRGDRDAQRGADVGSGREVHDLLRVRRSRGNSRPVASQRSQTNVVVIGRSPLKVPMSAVSWRPVVSVPAIAGAFATLGLKCCLSTIGKVWFVIATSEPATFVPVIQTRIEKPMSVGRRRVRAVRRARDLHAGREIADGVAATPGVRERDRRRTVPRSRGQRQRRVDGVPAEDLRCRASLTARTITGALDSEFCAADPRLFVAVTCTRNRLPASAVTGV